MKKLFVALTAMLLCATSLFAQFNPKDGYYKLKWGTSIADAKKAGYTLKKASEDFTQLIQSQHIATVETYVATSKDKEPKFVLFVYYEGKLFMVNEFLDKAAFGTKAKLEKRFGKFDKLGVKDFNPTLLMDSILDVKGNVKQMNFLVQIDQDLTSAYVVDWNVFKLININGIALSGEEEKTIADEFNDIANKIIQPQKNGQKPSITFSALSLDNGNVSVSNYITDALTEACFNTKSFKIIDRANLEKILAEQKFQSSGIVDEATAKKIGKIAGVDYVCFGTVKDIGSQLSVNVKVLDVETSEVCAMTRDNIKKDQYIKNNIGKAGSANNASSATGFASGSSTKNSSANSAPTKRAAPANCLWTVTKNRNDFDGYTTYTFLLKGPEERWLFVGYDKNDVQSKSIVRGGIVWRMANMTNSGKYDIKLDNGSILSKNYGAGYWSKKSGWKEGSQQFEFAYNKGESARFMLDLFGNNNSLMIRKKEAVQKFQTAGFWEYLESQGISKQEIYDAISNEEF